MTQTQCLKPFVLYQEGIALFWGPFGCIFDIVVLGTLDRTDWKPSGKVRGFEIMSFKNRRGCRRRACGGHNTLAFVGLRDCIVSLFVFRRQN